LIREREDMEAERRRRNMPNIAQPDGARGDSVMAAAEKIAAASAVGFLASCAVGRKGWVRSGQGQTK
jgi:hypothetical protein